jgi:hypothetical protein
VLEEAKAFLRRRRLAPRIKTVALPRLYETDLLFVHVPKCGGKTVIRDLYRLEDLRFFGHSDVRHFRNILGPRKFEQIHKVTFVRDPVERCLSGYRFNKTGGFRGRNGLKAQKLLGDLSFDEFVQGGMLEQFMSWHIVFRPQTRFLTDEDGRIAIDQICRFSNFEEELKGLMARLYEDVEVSHRNKSKAPKPAAIAEESRAIIAELYADDYKAFSEYF